MHRFRLNILAAVLVLGTAGLSYAQSEAEIQSDQVKRVGTHLNCQCGGCKDDLNCQMSGGQCHFCKPARTQIFEMQKQGMSDEAIVASFIKQYGEKIFRPDPSSWFWIVPYVVLGLGAVGILAALAALWVGIRKRTLQTAGGPSLPVTMDDDPDFARYRDAIEKDTERLE